jgi:lysophospholipase L1-like esterase
MKRSLVLIIFLLIARMAFAQQTKWDSTYRPGNYALKLAQFRSYPNSKKDIIFFGDSITDYTDWNELLQEKHAINRGISGDITFGLLERIDEVTEGKPAKVFILIGINDIGRNIPDSVILNNYKKIIRNIKSASPTTKIYFNTIFPVNNTFSDRAQFNKDEHILFINSELKKMAKSEKIILLNSYEVMLDGDKKFDRQLTYDGLHPNSDGYLKWAKFLKPYVND